MAGAAKGEGSVDLKLNIQPQVAKDSPTINLLKDTMSVVKWSGLGIPLIQFIWTRAFDARVFYFFAFTINM
jgi:hypothetical protein